MRPPLGLHGVAETVPGPPGKGGPRLRNCFRQTLDRLAPVLDQEGTGKTVAFFYITSNGGINVRKPGDYISKLIGMAGGEYVFQDLGGEENALSTMNLQMEAFYARGKGCGPVDL